MNNLEPALKEVKDAIAILQANGVLIARSIRGGWDVTNPGQWRREGQTPADLIELAAEYATEPKNEERP